LWWCDAEIQDSNARHDAETMEIGLVTLWSQGVGWRGCGVDAETWEILRVPDLFVPNSHGHKFNF
jgi:hypothetical protein